MKTTSVNRKMVGIMLAASTLTVMAGSIIGPVVSDIREALNVGASTAGLIITMHGVFVFLLSPLVGSLIDKIGSKRPYVVGLLLYGVAGGTRVFIDSYLFLLVSRAFLGVAVALIYTTVTVMILNLFEGRTKQRVMGLRGSTNSLGAVIWPLLGGALGTVSWHMPFAVYLVSIPIGGISLFFVPEVKRKRSEGNNYSVLSLFKENPILFFIYALMLLINLLLYVNVVYLPEVLEGIGFTSSFQAGLFLALMGAAAALTASQYDKIKKQVSYQKLVLLSFLLWGFGFGLAFFTASPWIYGIAVILFGFGQGLLLPTVMLWIGDVVASAFLGRFSSYLSTFGYLGQFLSPIVFAPVVTLLGLNGVFFVACIVATCGFIFTLVYLLVAK